MRESKKKFVFKQFTVCQDRCAMKVGTDGVLLGSWADVSSDRRILDVGCGTGLVALMVAQRSEAMVDSVELDSDAYQQAIYNFNESKFSARLRVFHAPFQTFSQTATDSYDHIVSNPPFFEESLLSPQKQRSMARHTSTLPFEELFEGVDRLLTVGGRFSLILPSHSFERISAIAAGLHFYTQRILWIHPTPHSEAKRVAACFSKQSCSTEESNLFIEHARHCYSEAYIALTRDYYLSM